MKLILRCTPMQQRLGYVNGLITLTSTESFMSRERLGEMLLKCVEDKQEKWLKGARSSTGKITKGKVNDIIDWATGEKSLRLLFPTTLTWRPEARLLNCLISDEEYYAFHSTSNYNPLILSMPERLFYLYKMLKIDGAALVYLMSNLGIEKTWTRKEAAILLSNIYREYGKFCLSSAETTADYLSSRKFIEVAERMNKSTRTRQGTVGTKELRVTTRLEVLVDLEIIDKPKNKKDSYIYCRNQITPRFIEKFNDWMEDEKNLDEKFFERCAYIYNLKAKPANNEEIFWSLIANFRHLEAAYGLAGIDEVCLLSGIKLLSSKIPKILEINRAKTVLIEKQKEYQRDIKLHVNSRGRIRYFSVSEKLLNSIPSNYQ